MAVLREKWGKYGWFCLKKQKDGCVLRKKEDPEIRKRVQNVEKVWLYTNIKNGKEYLISRLNKNNFFPVFPIRAAGRRNKKEACMSELRRIPGVGKNIEEDLRNIGIKNIDDLKGKDPQELYRKDCEFKGFQEDKCQLYVFRLAVYFAETENPDKEKLKWWYWKDKSYPQERPE